MLLSRHICKAGFLGTALLYLFFDPDRRALHDRLFGTVVVSNTPTPPPATQKLRSPIRAFFVSLVWSTASASLAVLIAAVLLGVVIELAGLEIPETPPWEAVLSLFVTVVFIYAQFRVLHRGALGRLPGTGGVSEPVAQDPSA